MTPEEELIEQLEELWDIEIDDDGITLPDGTKMKGFDDNES